jgi:hypothetical protein
VATATEDARSLGCSGSDGSSDVDASVGNGNLGPRDKWAEDASKAKLVSTETAPRTEKPANSGSFLGLQKMCRFEGCVVADAVIIEPVSILKFPANREKNREFFYFGTPGASREPTNPTISGLLSQIP